MYDIQIRLESLNCEDQSHVLLLDFLLKEAICKLNITEQYWMNNRSDVLYLYLIKSNDDVWRVSLFPVELAARPNSYQYRSVVELTVEDLVNLTKSKNVRYNLLQELLPKTTKTVVNYSNIIKEYNKNYN